MSDLTPWANELTEAELLKVVRGVSNPISRAAWGERMALNISSRTPEQVAELLKSTDDDTLGYLMEYVAVLREAMSTVTSRDHGLLVVLT